MKRTGEKLLHLGRTKGLESLASDCPRRPVGLERRAASSMLKCPGGGEGQGEKNDEIHLRGRLPKASRERIYFTRRTSKRGNDELGDASRKNTGGSKSSRKEKMNKGSLAVPLLITINSLKELDF